MIPRRRNSVPSLNFSSPFHQQFSELDVHSVLESGLGLGKGFKLTDAAGWFRDKGQGQNADRARRSVVSECADATSSEEELDATSSEKEVNMNMEAQYESDGEPDDAGRKQNVATADDRPMRPQNGSKSGHESKSGSDYINADESENNWEGRGERLDSEDEDGQKDSDVPAEEMLSDEYYDQDGEEQSDSVQLQGKSRILDDAEDDDGDADYEDDDEADVGGAVEAAPLKAQAELFNAFIDCCKEAAEGPLLDFYGVPVKANELLICVQELQLLAKCISRLDERLGLMKKIAPVELQHHETFLPRTPNLRDRANALLEQVSKMKTLKRLYRLQTTSANLPTEKVLSIIRNYLQLLGRRIDQIVSEQESGPPKQDSMCFIPILDFLLCDLIFLEKNLLRACLGMTTRLWKYVSTFSHLSGERLHQIYSKLILEQNAEGVAPSLSNGSVSGPFSRNGNPNHSYSFPRHIERQRGFQNVTTAYQMPGQVNDTYRHV
ncbi:hypothetical protein TSUD_132100 [Trifolium subterraneum]|uniref:Chromodomain-helicase-DNA-binding protein 1-like C-terminal domain-containing protein n=1 Tax=Trifolium subterraneum TaxID=3900 RepID=A0A2Z6LV36_TRISU|nr:hypothetical protein TSUD_132100 [Trifolium subterraneum]